MHVVLAAGGTGGHIEPALSTAEALLRIEPETAITFVGSERGLETTIVPARGFELVTVPSVPMPRRPGGDMVRLGPRLRSSVRQANNILRERAVDVVVGFGGYAAVPTYIAARRTRTPLVVHEANARAGIANRLAARLTSHLYESYPGALRGAEVLAPPLRHSVAVLDRAAQRSSAREHFGLDADARVLLVFGGSQGAQRLNDVLGRSLDALLADGIWVLHSFGARNAAPAERRGYVALPFIDRMDLAYAAADLALTRAGAMTCAELAAVGLPAIYVPLPIGNGEQRMNALPVIEAGGGVLVEDAQITPEWLIDSARSVLHDDIRQREMSAAAAAHGVRDADERLARIVLDVGRRGRR